MERVFLDANVLFSAAYLDDSGLLRLWKLRDVQLVTSGYAVAEAAGNLDTPDRRRTLESLLASVLVMQESDEASAIPPGVKLPPKDRPILDAAIRAGASFLLTGDRRHFGDYFGIRIGGVTILQPADYLRTR